MKRSFTFGVRPGFSYRLPLRRRGHGATDRLAYYTVSSLGAYGRAGYDAERHQLRVAEQWQLIAAFPAAR